MTISPHGGTLIPLLLQGEELKKERDKAKNLPQITISSRESSDLIMLGMGAFSPLTGFMNRENYESVLAEMHLKDGTFWPVPITLAVSTQYAETLKEGQEIALVDEATGEIVGIISVEEKFRYNKESEAQKVFQTESIIQHRRDH